MELFDLPIQKLDADLHLSVFGDLPSSLAAALHTPEVGDLVLQLLDKGWRAGQIASRVGAAEAGLDPEATVLGLLRGFVDQVPPDARWRQERAQLKVQASRSSVEAPASEESRQRWISEIRGQLGTPKAPRAQPLLRVRPPCSLCGAEGEFFVSRHARLCAACVALLESGTATMPAPGDADLPQVG